MGQDYELSSDNYQRLSDNYEMVDPRTAAYLRELNKAMEQNKKVVDAAEQICTCGNCIEARMNKTLSVCEVNKRM